LREARAPANLDFCIYAAMLVSAVSNVKTPDCTRGDLPNR